MRTAKKATGYLFQLLHICSHFCDKIFCSRWQMQQRGDRLDQGEGHELSCMSAYQLHMYERERVRKMVLPLLSDTCGHSSDTTGHRRTFGHTRTSNVGHTGHMSSDTSDTSDICPRTHLRTLSGHCRTASDTPDISDSQGSAGHVPRRHFRLQGMRRHGGCVLNVVAVFSFSSYFYPVVLR